MSSDVVVQITNMSKCGAFLYWVCRPITNRAAPIFTSCFGSFFSPADPMSEGLSMNFPCVPSSHVSSPPKGTWLPYVSVFHLLVTRFVTLRIASSWQGSAFICSTNNNQWLFNHKHRWVCNISSDKCRCDSGEICFNFYIFISIFFIHGVDFFVLS